MTDLKDKASEQLGEMKEAARNAKASAARRSTALWVAAAAVALLFAALILTGA